MELLLITYLAGGVLLILLAVPMRLKKIRPNYFYGVRVAKTLNDPEAWYAANAYAAGYLMAAGASAVLEITERGDPLFARLAPGGGEQEDGQAPDASADSPGDG
jgi:hypothetical protein